jgi:hypothetical protein
MRELEFLPSWYPMLRKKRRMLVAQTWLVAVVFVGLGVWGFVSHTSVQAKENLLNTRLSQLTESAVQLQKLNELESLKKQMSEQATLAARLGLNLPTARLIGSIEQMMPKEMALLDVTADFQQQTKSLSPLVAAKGEGPQIDRQLQVQLHGVSPSDVELGNFMIKLATIPNFANSSMSTADLHQNGRLMREFRISFSVNLNESEN